MSTPHVALGYCFDVTCTEELLQAHVDQILAGLEVTEDSVEAHARTPARFLLDTGNPAGPFELRLDGVVLVSTRSATGPLAHLLHQINRRAIEHSTHLTLLHAAAACAPRGPVLFPAAMESGKSTLVAGLALRGWPYVTDEIVAVRASGDIVAYPRAVSLDPGSWPLFPELRPDVNPRILELLPNQWQVSVPAVGGTVATRPSAPAAIVVTCYDPDEPTQLEPITALDGLRHLLEATFQLDRHPQRDLRALADIVDRTPCYSLRVGDLQEACELLETAFGTFPEPSGQEGMTANAPISIA